MRSTTQVLLIAVLLGCYPSSDRGTEGRVLLVGVDGASPRIVRRLMAEGRLPNLEGISREGSHGLLRPGLPLWSPRIWNSIVTGKSPEKHGIEGFAVRVDEARTRLYASTDRRAHALWNIASAAGLEVGVVNWWNTYPPDVVRGVLITDHLLPREVAFRRKVLGAERVAGDAPITFPPEWSDRVQAAVRQATPHEESLTEHVSLPEWVPVAQLETYRREDELIVRLALEIEQRNRPDLLLVFLPGLDRVSHWLWGAIEPAGLYPAERRLSGPERAAASDALLGYYQYVDGLLQRLLDRYGPNDLALVVSDHGFEAGVDSLERTGQHVSERARNGIYFAVGPGVVSGQSDGATIREVDVAPTILAWLGLAVARDMDGRVAAFLEIASVSSIETYDGSPVQRLGAGASGAEEEMLERLRELGYIE
jgi:predicted AlkP superfamily phosphohydrolase/phosphomutase